MTRLLGTAALLLSAAVLVAYPPSFAANAAVSLRGDIAIAVRSSTNIQWRRVTGTVTFPEDPLLLRSGTRTFRVPAETIRYMQRLSAEEALYAVEFHQPLSGVGQRGIFEVVSPRSLTIANSKDTLQVSFDARAERIVSRLLIMLGKNSAEKNEG
jgi:hypothetical protein